MIINPKAKIVENKSECIGKVPLISVVVITYNHQQYIEKCIDNIINQKINSDFEIILGEDDSEDNTRKICINYANKYSDKVRLFLHNADNKIYFNGEPTGRFNLIYSLSKCRGKYIFFCEGDDYWTDPNKLQKQVDFLEANPTYAGCYHDTLVKYTNHEKPDHLFREELPQSMNAEDTLATLSPFHTSSFMFKKDSFSFEPFLTKVKSGDMAIFSIVASRGLLGKVDGIMSVYIKHESGVTNSFNHNHDFHQHRIE
jgi:glycosyltransferase involved in cell wall biosynthesis